MFLGFFGRSMFRCAHSSLYTLYPIKGTPRCLGSSGWRLIETPDSYNGQRENDSSGQAFFLQWFSANAFGGSNYSNTPVAAVSDVHEPTIFGMNDNSTYFSLWASGKNFAISAWVSGRSPYLQAVGDPLIKR